MGVSANYQLLSEQDVKAIQQGSNGAATLQNLINQGLIKDNGDGTYSGDVNKLGAQANIWASSNAAGVGNVDGAKDPANVTPAPGTGVERTGNPEQKKGVTTVVTTTHTATLGSLVQALGIDLNDGEINDLKQVLQDEGIEIDGDGNMSFNNKTQIEQACMKFAKDHGMSYVEGEDEGGKAKLEELATANEDALTPNGDGSYTINEGGEELINEAFNPKGEPTEFVDEQPLSLNVKTTTTTVEEKNAVEVGDDLRHDKAARKQAKKDYEAALEEWVKEPENQAVKTYSIAQNHYSKKITKQVAKIKKECPTKVHLLQKYYDEYATDDEKVTMAAMGDYIQKNVSDYDLAQALRESSYENYNNHFSIHDVEKKYDDAGNELPNDKRDIAVKAYIANSKEFKFNAEVLLDRIATVDVLGSRSDKKAEKDDKRFIKEEAERQVKGAETEQNIQNTVIHFSKEERKNAAKSETNTAIEHTDLGKYGRKLVMECPGEFCDEVAGTESYDFEKDGKYYKFNQEKFNEKCHQWADPENANREGYDTDDYATLNELRGDWTRYDLLQDGQSALVSLDRIIGNGNDKTSNRELNRFRKLVETTGRNVDKNKTAAKKALHVVEATGIGAGLGFATAGLSSVLTGAVSYAGTVASELVPYSGNVGYAGTTDYAGVAKGQVLTQTSDTVDGFTINHNVWSDVELPYSGTTDYSGTVAYDGAVEAPERPYSGKVKQNHLKNGLNGALFGGISGAVTGLSTMDKVQDEGTRFDGRVKLNTSSKSVETNDESMNLKLQRNVTEQTMECEQPGKQIDNWEYKIKVTNKSDKINEAEDKFDIVKRMYGITDDATAQKVYLYIMNEINGTTQVGKYQYSGDLKYYFPKTIPANTIEGITADLTGTDPSTLTFNKNEIRLGGINAKNNTQKNLNTQGSTGKIRLMKVN